MQDKTSQKIIETTLRMIAEQGYKKTTTIAIAKRAGVSEVTIFRKFGNKKGIVVEGFKKMQWYLGFERILNENCTGNIFYDLKVYANEYIKIFNNYGVKCLLNLRQEGFEELQDALEEVPNKLIIPLTEYFKKMQEKGQLRSGDAAWQAQSFIMGLFGMIMSKTIWNSMPIEQEIENYISNLIDLYANLKSS